MLKLQQEASFQWRVTPSKKELHLLIFIFNHKVHLMKNAILCNWRKILAIGWAHKSYQVKMST